jgi:predicted acylesterase/phospholipase RssA
LKISSGPDRHRGPSPKKNTSSDDDRRSGSALSTPEPAIADEEPGDSAKLPDWLLWLRHWGSLIAPAWFILTVTVVICYLLSDAQTIEALQAIESNQNLRSGSIWAVGVYGFTAGYFAMAVMSVAYPGNTPPAEIANDREKLRRVELWTISIAVFLITIAVPTQIILIGIGNDMGFLVRDGWWAIGGIVGVIVLGKLPGSLIELLILSGVVPAERAVGSNSIVIDRKSPLLEALLPLLPTARNLWSYVEGPAKILNLALSPFNASTIGARNARLTGPIFGTALVVILASLFLLVNFVLSPVTWPQEVGTLAIVLWAAASWIAFSSIFMIYFPLRYGLPSLLAFLLVGGLAAVFSLWNNNHTPCLACADLPSKRLMFSDFATGWIESRSAYFAVSAEIGKKTPVYVVAASGGGIRAAYWTAAVLAEFERQVPGFSCHVLAISGVSGGSLGAAAYAAALADDTDYRCEAAERGSEAAKPELASKTLDMLSRDFLSPLLAGILFPDGVQRLNPLPFEATKLPDRARAQERAWEVGWEQSAGTARFADPFVELWRSAKPGTSSVPPLFLNGTIVETGHPVTVSPFSIEGNGSFSDTFDLLHRWPKNLPLSTAVDMSTRFPYVSPAATIELENEGRQFRVVDGGYFENSGAHVALQIGRAFVDAAGDKADQFQIVPILIINDPDRTPDGSLSPEQLLMRPPLGASSGESWLLAELRSPVIAAMRTRSARGFNAEQALIRHFGADCTIVAGATGGKVALGWLLSQDSIDTLDNSAFGLFSGAAEPTVPTNNAARLLAPATKDRFVQPVAGCASVVAP